MRISPDAQARERRQIEEMRSRGSIAASEDEVGFLTSLAQAAENPPFRTSVQPLDLTTTVLADAQLLRRLPSGVIRAETYSGQTRLFQTNGYGKAALIENEYRFSGRTTIALESERETLRGMPFSHQVRRAPSGNSLTVWIWYNRDREIEYMLYIERTIEVDSEDYLAFFELITRTFE